MSPLRLPKQMLRTKSVPPSNLDRDILSLNHKLYLHNRGAFLDGHGDARLLLGQAAVLPGHVGAALDVVADLARHLLALLRHLVLSLRKKKAVDI